MAGKKSDFTKKKSSKGYAIFLIVYILIVIIPAIIIASGEYAWINIVLSAGLVALVLFYYFDDTYATSVSWGMSSIYTSRESEDYYMDYQRTHFWKETDIMLSYDIKLFLKTKIDVLSVMAKLGSKMRILLLDPESKYVPMVEDACGMKHGEYAYYVLQIQNFKSRVLQGATEKTVVDIDIKFYDDYPLDNILCAGDVMFAYDNKQNSSGNYMSYTYENGLNGFNYYNTLFAEKWNDELNTYHKEVTVDMVNNYRYFADNDTISYSV